MGRGQIYDAVLGEAAEVWGSEQAGFRPVLVVSRDAINTASSIVVVVPCTTYREERRVYPSQVRLGATEGGLQAESLVLTEQVRAVSRRRLRRLRGELSRERLKEVERALSITLDL